MGLFGGSAQSSNSIMNSIDFSPNIQFGDGNESSVKKTADQTSTLTPKLDDSFGVAASVGVGMGGSGSGGPASFSRAQEERQNLTPNPVQTAVKGVMDSNNTMIYIGVAVAVVFGGVYFIKKKK